MVTVFMVCSVLALVGIATAIVAVVKRLVSIDSHLEQIARLAQRADDIDTGSLVAGNGRLFVARKVQQTQVNRELEQERERLGKKDDGQGKSNDS